MNQAPYTQSNNKRHNQPLLPRGGWYIVSAGFGLFAFLYWLSRSFTVVTEKYTFWVQGGVNILIFAAILAQVLIYRRQWAVMERQGDAMQSGLTKTDEMIEKMQGQLSAVREQVQIMRVQLEVADRPWLRVDAAASERLYFTDEGGAEMAFEITATNIGRSVAVNAAISAKVVVPQCGVHPYEQILETQQAVSDNVRKWAEFTYTVFPEHDFAVIYHYPITRAEIEGAQQSSPHYVKAYLVGCVDYQFVGHDARHQTRFARRIARKSGGELGSDLKIGEAIPKEELILEKKRVPGDYAD